MLEIAYIVLGALVSLLVSMLLFSYKRVILRLDIMEQELQNKLDEAKARIIIKDKTDPLKDRMVSIEKKLDRLLDLQLNGKK